MDTRDLDSYYPGYDQYCERLERENRVPYSDYVELEDEIRAYKNLMKKIDSVLSEKTTLKKKIQLIQAVIQDFEEE